MDESTKNSPKGAKSRYTMTARCQMPIILLVSKALFERNFPTPLLQFCFRTRGRNLQFFPILLSFSVERPKTYSAKVALFKAFADTTWDTALTWGK